MVGYSKFRKALLYAMISYEPFWDTLEKKHVTTYDLIFKQGLSANTIYRKKHNEAITTKTLDELCFILGCKVSDIIIYIEDEND